MTEAAETHEFVVTVDYQTRAGNPASKRLDLRAVDEEAAIDQGIRRVRAYRNCLKVNGGDAVRADATRAPGV